jgi:hypothetical protein
MPRAEVMDEGEYAYVASLLPALAGVEAKASSWGWLGEEPVAVDYGWRS